MRSLRHRIGALERDPVLNPPSAAEETMARALERLSDEQLQLLVSSHPDKTEQREHTPAESAAWKTYYLALDQECRRTIPENPQHQRRTT
jgi:hypothetical protein